MRTAAVIGAFLLSGVWLVEAQRLPVRIQPPIYVRSDTGEAGRAEELLAAYMRKRFDALGVRMILPSDTGSAAEVNFSVLPVDRGYDIAAVLTIAVCPASAPLYCHRGVPFDWMQFHSYQDLEQVARDVAERVYTELEALAGARRRIDSLLGAQKH
jgi:hypothetical protein